MWMLLMALALIAASGLPSVCLGRAATAGAIGGAIMVAVGAGMGLWQAFATIVWGIAGGGGGGAISTEVLKENMPVGSLRLALDTLGAFFLVPIFLIGALGTIYGMRYWKPASHPRSGPQIRLFYGWLIASMGLVVLAVDAVGFLLAWEIMSLSSFGLIVADDHRQKVRQAGWLYLVATHLSVLLLMAMFALWYEASGSFAFEPLNSSSASPGIRSTLFLMALIGFGCKAGMMPLHFWLPDAHAHAPSHVSALLSGVVIKMGIYGLIRFGLLLLPSPPLSWGILVLTLGTISAVLGVVFAISQHDLKRLLAYHSVENIGIILMGLGMALIGVAAQRPAWTALGLAGCLLHVWNHGLFKSQLFLSAGAVILRTHTRQIDRLGGLAKFMPYTAAAFLLGAVAICGLPPLNGFVSEWLVYVGLFGPLHEISSAGGGGEGVGGGYAVLALAAPALALVGALAVACFVKAYGTVFLGVPRRHLPDGGGGVVGIPMLLPMGMLAACCVVLGIFPRVGIAAVTPIVAQAAGTSRASIAQLLLPANALNPWTLSIALALLAAVGISGVWMGRHRVVRAATWCCGFARPMSRMQYSSSSFAASLQELFRWVVRPQITAVRLTAVFPGVAHFCSHVGDLVLDGCLLPLWSAATRSMVNRRTLQQGNVQRYLLYIFLMLFVLLLSLMPWQEIWLRVLTHG